LFPRCWDKCHVMCLSFLLMMLNILNFDSSDRQTGHARSGSVEVAEQTRRLANREIDKKTEIIPMRPEKTKGHSVFISVKTGRAYHQTRLPVLFETWITYAPNETFFVTDRADEDVTRQLTGKHLVVSGCADSNERYCCICLDC
jgi:hypothetical protein